MPWLHWFLAQVGASALANTAVLGAVKDKALFWGIVGNFTVGKDLGLTRVSRATAYRHLSDLVQKGALKPHGHGRRQGYRLAWKVFDKALRGDEQGVLGQK